MPTVTVTRDISAPLAQVWDVLRDFGNTADYNPAVPVSAQVGDTREAVGAQRRCDVNASGSKWVLEQITDWDAANHRYSLEMIDGPGRPPVERFTVDIEATESGTDHTTVSMTASMQTKGMRQGLMGKAAKPMLTKVFGQVLAGLAHHVATGEKVVDVKQLRAAGVAF